MAGALGLLTGLGLGAAAGFAKQKAATHQQHDAALFDFYSKNPQLVADSPEAQGFIKKYAGKDASTAFITMANHVKQASSMFGQQMGGGGGPSGAPQQAGQARPSMPTDPAQIQDHISKIEAFLGSPDARYLSPEQLKVGTAHLEQLRQEYGRLQGAQLKTADELAKEKRAPGVEAAKTTARIGAETSPEATKAEAGKAATVGAARSGAEARAKLAPDITDKEVQLQKRKSQAEASAKEGKAADPEVEANRRATRYNGQLTAFMKLYPPPTNWTGVARQDMSTPAGRKYLAQFQQHLAAHGMGPNGELFEATATGPNGQKKAFYDGAWHDL